MNIQARGSRSRRPGGQALPRPLPVDKPRSTALVAAADPVLIARDEFAKASAKYLRHVLRGQRLGAGRQVPSDVDPNRT